MSLSPKPALSARSLPDRERFAYAKEHGSIELLLELMNCDEAAHVTRHAESSEHSNFIQSELVHEWLGEERLLSHCAINQLTYNLVLKRKELRVHIYFNTQEKRQICLDLLEMRRYVFKYFDEHKALERRLQRYLLMSDDSGLQAILYLLLKLSDDEIKGIRTAIEAAAKAQSMQQTTTENVLNLPSSSSQSEKFLGSSSPKGAGSNSVGSSQYLMLDKKSQQTAGKLLSKMKADPLWALDKEFKAASWFKKSQQLIIDSVDNLLSDMSFSQTTVRISLLLLANLNTITKA